MFESIFSKSILSIVLREQIISVFFVVFFFLALPISNFSKNRRFRAEGSLPPPLTPPNPPSFFLSSLSPTRFDACYAGYEEGRDTPPHPPHLPPQPHKKHFCVY